MSEKKLIKGIYYSCEHQEINNNECDTCKKERGRESKLAEANIKREKCRKLGIKRREQNTGGSFTDEEKEELDQLIKWAKDNVGEDWSTTPYFSNVIHADNSQIETTFYGCQVCHETIVESKGRPGPSENEITIKEDCYLKGDSNYTCAKCYEKHASNQIKSNQIKSNQIKSNQIKSNHQSSSSNQDNKNYLPWILGGVGAISLIGLIAYFLTKKRGRKE